MQWMYNNNPVDDIIDKYHSFVYIITNVLTGKKYIGKKKSYTS
jgi:hypothetical protein